MNVGTSFRIVGAVLRRPQLWLTALRQWRRTTPSDWWKHRPFMPLPSAGYLKFRLVTQYGDSNARVEPADVLNYLAWCRHHDQAA
ncbi:MAG: hypothetical protein F2681_11260 [Actinobacteria bacterium]|uniref:Unannotated protein n=1 Tax=freshwater metagenome TaxID=449393 RepID=A0A6J6A7B3_9ZZZZ|nr:hypothetical protein [Actinomycetota bacterium]MSW78724.1 hypothetical protein [Actinomycetota bacterium]MSX55887.1 hypothetical protein [Actinomycetota bacterium]MSZ83706.1 hypothetical protein [Actinomycetota bacterium]MTB18376.1 hypothetical protein [Actinomycetota bacterium]